MRNVVIALKPKWLDLILRGEKTIEFRRALPNDICNGDIAYLYNNKKLHGECKILDVIRIPGMGEYNHIICCRRLADMYSAGGQIDADDAYAYLAGGKKPGVIFLGAGTKYREPVAWAGPVVQNFVYYNK